MGTRYAFRQNAGGEHQYQGPTWQRGAIPRERGRAGPDEGKGQWKACGKPRETFYGITEEPPVSSRDQLPMSRGCPPVVPGSTGPE